MIGGGAPPIVTAMLPLAHIGHYLVWALYALPVLAVIAGIAYSTYAGRNREREGGEG